MKRFLITSILAAMALALPGGVSKPVKAENATELRIATLAPSGSSWMKVFNAWNRTLKKETNNTLKFRFYAGGSQGDERDFIRKMRAGQMDGAAITTTGLGQLVRPVLVLAVPGVIEEYKQLDAVRSKLNKDFEKLFLDEGFVLLGWGDVGKTRIFSTQMIKSPEDVKSARPWAWKDDLIWTEVLKVIGANPVKLGVPEVYPALQTKMVDTLPSSALAAVSLQWYTRLKYMSEGNSGIITGATIIRKDKFDSLSEEQKTALVETGKRAGVALRKAIRRDDEKAYKTILKRGTQLIPEGTGEAEWDSVGAKARKRLAGRVYPQSLLDAVKSAAAGAK